LKRGTPMRLTEQDSADARVIGNARWDNNRTHGVPVQAVCSEVLDVNGVAGELAFCRLIGADDSEIRRIGVTSAALGTDLGDVEWNGYRIDVKTTHYANGHLLITENKLKNSAIDGYVLMTGGGRDFVYRGYISRDDVLAGTFDQGSPNTYWIPQSALYDLPAMHGDIQLPDTALLIDGCDAAIVGTYEQAAVYDYNLLVNVFVERGMSLEEAAEWVNFNIMQALPYYEQPPLVIELTAKDGGAFI